MEPRSPALQVDSLSAEPPGNSKYTGVGSLSLLQWIFPTQESDWGLLQCRRPRFDSWFGWSPGEGIGYPLQYSWASLVTQLVKNPRAMWETWVQSLGWEDPVEEGMAIHSSILAWRTFMDRGAWWAIVYGVTKNRTWLNDKHSTAELMETSMLLVVVC